MDNETLKALAEALVVQQQAASSPTIGQFAVNDQYEDINSAARYADLSRQWASNPEDLEINDGVNEPNYSAYHYMLKTENAIEDLDELLGDQIENITEEGERQVNLIIEGGERQLDLITTEGDLQVSLITSEGELQVDLVESSGTESIQAAREWAISEEEVEEGEFSSKYNATLSSEYADRAENAATLLEYAFQGGGEWDAGNSGGVYPEPVNGTGTIWYVSSNGVGPDGITYVTGNHLIYTLVDADGGPDPEDRGYYGKLSTEVETGDVGFSGNIIIGQEYALQALSEVDSQVYNLISLDENGDTTIGAFEGIFEIGRGRVNIYIDEDLAPSPYVSYRKDSTDDQHLIYHEGYKGDLLDTEDRADLETEIAEIDKKTDPGFVNNGYYYYGSGNVTTYTWTDPDGIEDDVTVYNYTGAYIDYEFPMFPGDIIEFEVIREPNRGSDSTDINLASCLLSTSSGDQHISFLDNDDILTSEDFRILSDLRTGPNGFVRVLVLSNTRIKYFGARQMDFLDPDIGGTHLALINSRGFRDIKIIRLNETIFHLPLQEGINDRVTEVISDTDLTITDHLEGSWYAGEVSYEEASLGAVFDLPRRNYVVFGTNFDSFDPGVITFDESINIGPSSGSEVNVTQQILLNIKSDVGAFANRDMSLFEGAEGLHYIRIIYNDDPGEGESSYTLQGSEGVNSIAYLDGQPITLGASGTDIEQLLGDYAWHRLEILISGISNGDDPATYEPFIIDQITSLTDTFLGEVSNFVIYNDSTGNVISNLYRLDAPLITDPILDSIGTGPVGTASGLGADIFPSNELPWVVVGNPSRADNTPDEWVADGSNRISRLTTFSSEIFLNQYEGESANHYILRNKYLEELEVVKRKFIATPHADVVEFRQEGNELSLYGVSDTDVTDLNDLLIPGVAVEVGYFRNQPDSLGDVIFGVQIKAMEEGQPTPSIVGERELIVILSDGALYTKNTEEQLVQIGYTQETVDGLISALNSRLTIIEEEVANFAPTLS